MNKKATVMAVALVASLGVFAAPHGGPRGGGPRGGVRRAPPPRMVSHHGGGSHHRGGHHHYSAWGRGGSHFWPGFVGGVVGGMLYDAVVPSPRVVTTQVVTPPVVVTQPVVTAPVATVQNVWVEGRYVDQVQPNGVVIRVWQPGHYEQRTVYVQ